MTEDAINSDVTAWEVLDRVQLCRNFTEVKQALPGIPTEPPQKWLAHVLSLPPEQRPKLVDALERFMGWKENVQAIYDHPAIQKIARIGSLEGREGAILKLAQSLNTDSLVACLKSAGILNVDTWSRDLKRSQGDAQVFQDYLIEGYYALSFARCGFQAELKPTGPQGPDLKVTIGGTEVFVEVSRFREDEDLRAKMEQPSELTQMPERSQKVLAKIETEAKQLPDGKPGIVLLHSNNVGVDEVEFQGAIAYKATPLAKCSAMIFLDTWRKLGDGTYPTCWGSRNSLANIPLQPDTLNSLGKCLDPNFKLLNDS